MKKLSILMALILCVSVGSVYAQWLYTGTSMTGVDRSISSGLTAATTEGDLGYYSIASNTYDVAIDQAAQGDYSAVMRITGGIEVHFVPNPGAPADIEAGDIPTQARVYITGADAHLYNGEPIYVSTGTTVDLVWEAEQGQGGHEGHFIAYLDADDLDSMLDLGGDFELPTYVDYQAFHALESNVVINIAIEPKAVNNQVQEP